VPVLTAYVLAALSIWFSTVNKQNWSHEEDTLIVNCLQTMGTKWSDIAKLMRGRTDNAIKNRWYSTVRRVERFKRAGSNKQMFATPTDVKKNNNPLFHFCLSVQGKGDLNSFGPGQMGTGTIMPPGQAVQAQAASASAMTTPLKQSKSTVHQPLSASSDGSTALAGSSNAWMNGSLGSDAAPLSYPSMGNVTVASAVDAADLQTALQTPPRPTSRSTGRGTPASAADDSDSPFPNTISARRGFATPTMLDVHSPHLPVHNLRSASSTKRALKGGAAAGAQVMATSGGQNSGVTGTTPTSSKTSGSLSGVISAAKRRQHHLGLKSDGTPDPDSDTMPMQMHVEFAQTASEEARAMQFDIISPQSAKMLAVPGSHTLQSPPSSASTPSPLSGSTNGSLSPYSSLSPYPVPPTPPTYALPPNTIGALQSSSSRATRSAQHQANSVTFPMPSPALIPSGQQHQQQQQQSSNLTQQFHHAASMNNGSGLPPHTPNVPTFTHYNNSPMPSARPQLQGQFSNISGLLPPNASASGGASGSSSLFSPSTMMDFSNMPPQTPAIIGGQYGNGQAGPYSSAPYSVGMSLATPAIGGSFSSAFPLNSPALHGAGQSGMMSSAFGGGPGGMLSPGVFPMGNPSLYARNSSIQGGPGMSYTVQSATLAIQPAGGATAAASSSNSNSPQPPTGGKRKSFDSAAAIANYNQQQLSTGGGGPSGLSLNVHAASSVGPTISPSRRMLTLPSNATKMISLPPSPSEKVAKKMKMDA
jgi:hypothetical protein